VIDAVLHEERLNMGFSPRASFEALPDGTFVTFDDQDAYLILNGQLMRWTPAGYKISSKTNIPARVLTPPSIVRTLKAGYPVGLHSSAFEG
jgi:hypothetical protein